MKFHKREQKNKKEKSKRERRWEMLKKLIVALVVLGLIWISGVMGVNGAKGEEGLGSVIVKVGDPIVRVSTDDFLEEFIVIPVDAKTFADNKNENRFIFVSKFKLELKIKKLDKEIADYYRSLDPETLKSEASSVGHWDRTIGCHTTFTQMYDRSIYYGGPNGYYDFVHFIIATGRIDYLDPQYTATELWFKYNFFSRKFREPDPYTEVAGSPSYKQEMYPHIQNPTPYETYYFQNLEDYWRDIYPSSSWCWTHFEVDLKRGGTTWATYVNFKIKGSEIIIQTEPGTHPD